MASEIISRARGGEAIAQGTRIVIDGEIVEQTFQRRSHLRRCFLDRLGALQPVKLVKLRIFLRRRTGLGKHLAQAGEFLVERFDRGGDRIGILLQPGEHAFEFERLSRPESISCALEQSLAIWICLWPGLRLRIAITIIGRKNKLILGMFLQGMHPNMYYNGFGL